VIKREGEWCRNGGRRDRNSARSCGKMKKREKEKNAAER
jgi:hypothetical protein